MTGVQTCALPICVHNGLSEIAQSTLGIVGQPVERDVCDDPSEHCVTEELESLVRIWFVELCLVGPVHQRQPQPGRVTEFVSETTHQVVQVGFDRAFHRGQAPWARTT